MRGVLGRCPLLAIAASYFVAAGVFLLAVLQAAHGQWQCLLLFAGTCAGFLAGFRVGVSTPEAPGAARSRATGKSRTARRRARPPRAFTGPLGTSAGWRFDFRTRSFTPLRGSSAEDVSTEESGYQMRRVTAYSEPSVRPRHQCAPRAFTAATAVDHRSWMSRDRQR